MADERYEIYQEYEQALRNLNDEAWVNLLPNERLGVLQAIENKLALDSGRSFPAEVIAGECKPGAVAMQDGNSIIIDEKILASPDYMMNVESLYHEDSHVMDFHASIFARIREEIGVDAFEARNSPIPDYMVDMEGYYNHPAEIAARQAEEAGVQQTIEDQAQIVAVDKTMHCSRNQILVTHDYLALDYDNGMEPVDTHQCDVSISEGVEMAGSDDD